MCNSHKMPHPRKNFYHRSWCAVALLLLVFFAPSPAMASGWHLLHEEDFAYKFLLMIVGQPINYFAAPSPIIDGDNPEVIFGALSMYWNSFLMTLSAILVLVAFFTTSLSGAGNKEGKIEGAAKHAPAKAVLTLVGLTPIVSGFSLVQMAALGMTSYGIMAANQLATTGVNHVLNGGAMFGKAKTIGDLVPQNTGPLVKAGAQLGVCHAVLESMEVNMDMSAAYEDRNSIVNSMMKAVTGGPDPKQYALGQIFSLFALPTGPTSDISDADGFIYAIAPNYNPAIYFDERSGIMGFFSSKPQSNDESPLQQQTIEMETADGKIFVHREPLLKRWKETADVARWIGAKHSMGAGFLKKNLWVTPQDSACGYFGLSPDRVSLANFDELESLKGMFQISKEDVISITGKALDDYTKAQGKYIAEYNDTANFLIRQSWELTYNSALVQNWPGSKLSDTLLRRLHKDAKEQADSQWESMSDELKEVTNKEKLIQEELTSSLQSLCGFPRGIVGESRVFARTGSIPDNCSGTLSENNDADLPEWSEQYNTLITRIREQGTVRALRLKAKHDEMVAAFLRPIMDANNTLDPRDINNPGAAQPNPFRLNELTKVARDPDNNPIFAFGLGAWYWKLPQFAEAVQSVPQSEPVNLFEQGHDEEDISRLVKSGVRFNLEDISDAPATPVQTVEEYTEFAFNMLQGGNRFGDLIISGDDVSLDSSDQKPSASSASNALCSQYTGVDAAMCWFGAAMFSPHKFFPTVYQMILTNTIDGFRYIITEQSDPLMNTSLWLQKILSDVELAIAWLIALYAAIKISIFVVDGILAALRSLPWGTGTVVATAATIPSAFKLFGKERMLPLLTAMAGKLFLLAGVVAYTAYMLPAIPFIYFNFAVITYFMLIMESLVATPLWAAAHSIPAGQGGFTGHARSGYMIMLNLSVRPVLLVFGFFTSILLLRVSITYTIYLFEPMLTGLQLGSGPSQAATAFLPFIATLIILVGVLIQATHKSFAVIADMQDQVMRYIGGQGLGGNSNDVAEATGKAKMAAGIGGKMATPSGNKADKKSYKDPSQYKDPKKGGKDDPKGSSGGKGGIENANAKGKADDQLSQTDAKGKSTIHRTHRLDDGMPIKRK